MPVKGTGGGSLNAYIPTMKQWRQTWIGSQSGQVDFVGGLAGGKMVLAGFWAGQWPWARRADQNELHPATRWLGSPTWRAID